MPSYKQLQFRMYLRRAGGLLAVLASGAALYFLFQLPAVQNAINKMSKIEPTKFEDKSDELGTDEFNEYLEQVSAQQLILKSSELVDDPTQELIIRLDQQDRKTKIADRLMEFADDERANNIGMAAKLDSMRVSQLIKFDHGLADASVLEELKLKATGYATRADARVKRQASVSRIYAMVISELLLSNSDSFSFEEQTKREFANLCRTEKNDEFVAGEMLKLLERIFVHAPESQQLIFSKAFSDGFSESELARSRTLAENVEKHLVSSEFELVDIFDSVDSMRDAAIQKLQQQINETLSTNQVSGGGYQRIFSAIQDVVRAGDYKIADELTQTFQTHIAAKPAYQSLAEKTQKLRQQVKLVGAKIPVGVLQDLSGGDYEFKNPDAKVKALCFMPKDTFKKSDQLLFKIMRQAGRFVAEKKFVLTAVYVDYGDSPESLKEIKKMQKLLKILDFCRLDANSSGGKDFLNRLSMIDPPMLLLLDQNSKIEAINVTDQDFQKRFLELNR